MEHKLFIKKDDGEMVGIVIDYQSDWEFKPGRILFSLLFLTYLDHRPKN
jgi:hypothetical protein